MPGIVSRAAWTCRSCFARSRTASATFCFCFDQDLPPSFERGGRPWKPPMYFWMRSICVAGT